jgi:uncharacterized membrane protein
LTLLSLIASLFLILVGLLSLLTGAAYWSVKGSAVAAFCGLALVATGLLTILGIGRRLGEKRRRPHA